ncbi:uncharacterized protein A4U43_C05F21740 [Asparagus officinalis]|uniref:Phosphofructokinase domain-containing protein n=1 Tax=Asparagus officinalis TaxID=4686 RepID=A0A5P1ETL9_ASPOF|nr:uncharacterized protein A4U43_C05F21740 [Asparagus officinalis]
MQGSVFVLGRVRENPWSGLLLRVDELTHSVIGGKTGCPFHPASPFPCPSSFPLQNVLRFPRSPPPTLNNKPPPHRIVPSTPLTNNADRRNERQARTRTRPPPIPSPPQLSSPPPITSGAPPPLLGAPSTQPPESPTPTTTRSGLSTSPSEPHPPPHPPPTLPRGPHRPPLPRHTAAPDRPARPLPPSAALRPPSIHFAPRLLAPAMNTIIQRSPSSRLWASTAPRIRGDLRVSGFLHRRAAELRPRRRVHEWATKSSAAPCHHLQRRFDLEKDRGRDREARVQSASCGASTGHIALHSTLSSRDVDCCLIPETEFYLEGKGGLFEFLDQTLKQNGHAVIVVAEGAGQDMIPRTESQKEERDESGNPVFLDVGPWLKSELKKWWAKEHKGELLTVKYIDPTYMIRAVPANATDNLYCTLLAHSSIHGVMAGYTGFRSTGITGIYPWRRWRRRRMWWIQRIISGHGSGR